MKRKQLVRLNVYETVVLQALEEAFERTQIPIRKEMYLQLAEAIATGDLKVILLADLLKPKEQGG